MIVNHDLPSGVGKSVEAFGQWIMDIIQAISTELPADLNFPNVRGHLTDDQNRLADSIKVAFDRRANQLVIHPGINESERFNNYPLFGAAKHIGLMAVWIGKKDP